MAQLPADRTKLTLAQQNQVAGLTAIANYNINAITEAYDTIDLLNQKVDNYLANPTIADGAITSPKLADNAVITRKIANGAVTNQKIADGVITANKFVPGALTNETQNGLRITELEEEVDEHKADYMQYKASRINLDLIGSVKYGKIELPEDFNHNLDFDLWRDPDGIIRHNFDLDAKMDGWTTYYVSENGDQSKDGLTPETAKKSLGATIDEIEADVGVTSAKIIVLGKVLTRTYAATVKTVTKNYAIIAQEDVCYIGSIEAGLTWTAHTTGVYKAIRTHVRNVFDSRYKGAYNLPMRLEKKEALADCESTPGTWFTDGSLVYVHLLDGSPIDNSEVFVTVDATTNQIKFGADKLFIMKGFTHLFGGSSQPCYFSSVDTTKGNVILDSVTIFSSEGNANGISCNGIKSIWSFNCKTFDIGRDGFNYHSVIDGDTFAFEYYCLAENCGLNNTNGNNNATTAHEGMRVLRIGTKGKNTKGPVLADVNGCYSICVDCSMDNSLLATPAETRAAFYFGDDANKGKAILINCSGGDVNTKGINCDESFKAAGKITIDNFQGRNIPDDINFTIV